MSVSKVSFVKMFYFIRLSAERGMLSADINGRRRDHHIDLEEQPLVAAERWIEDTRNFWQSRLDRLERFLHAPDKTKED